MCNTLGQVIFRFCYKKMGLAPLSLAVGQGKTNGFCVQLAYKPGNAVNSLSSQAALAPVPLTASKLKIAYAAID